MQGRKRGYYPAEDLRDRMERLSRKKSDNILDFPQVPLNKSTQEGWFYFLLDPNAGLRLRGQKLLYPVNQMVNRGPPLGIVAATRLDLPRRRRIFTSYSHEAR